MHTNFFPISVKIGDLVILDSYCNNGNSVKSEIVSLVLKGPFNPDQFHDIIISENIQLDFREKSFYKRSIPRRIFMGASDGKIIYFHQNNIIEKL